MPKSVLEKRWRRQVSRGSPGETGVTRSGAAGALGGDRLVREMIKGEECPRLWGGSSLTWSVGTVAGGRGSTDWLEGVVQSSGG